MKKIISLASIVASIFVLNGCGLNSKQMVVEDVQQLEVRSYQQKKYSNDKKLVLKSAIATLQDLSFIIDRADDELGTVAATKYKDNSSMRMTIVVRKFDEHSVVVRVNAEHSQGGGIPKGVDDPEVYQAFFSMLDKAIFFENEKL